MNHDDVIRMAREAGATNVDAADPQCWVGAIAFDVEELSRFAALVAAAEREECAALCEQGIGDWRLGKRVSAAIRARGGE